MNGQELTPESFARLLKAISKSPGDNGADEYERIRRKLGRYFRAHSIETAEELADTVFDRVALKLMKNDDLDLTTDSYFFAVGRFVLLEYVNGKRKRTVSLDEEEYHIEPSIDPFEDADRLAKRITQELGLEAIAKCKQRLSRDESEILLTYDQGTGKDKIDRRTALAERYGKSKATLIVAVSRIRSKIKDCVKAKLNLVSVLETS